MPTNITQIEDAERGKMILRIEGSMTFDDAVLLEKIALDLRSELDENLTLDLADLHFMDSDSAPVIKRLEREHGFEIEGIEVFLQNIVAETEAKTNGAL
jgi:anti-anti-sigma regulatory factor